MATKPENQRPNRKKKPKQGFLPDMEPPSIKELDDAADIYYDVVHERLKLNKEEDEAKDNLIDKMKEHGVDRYETADGKVVTITATANVKVKPKKEPKSESNGEAEE